MIKTKLEFVQEVLYEVYGGITSADDRISERFVLTKVNDKIAARAVVDAHLLTNLEGITYANDMFYVSFKNLALTMDEASGYKFLPLPAHPIGLPRNRSFIVYPPTRGNCAGMDSTLFKPVALPDVARLNSFPCFGKIFFFIKDGKMFFKMPKSKTGIDISEVCIDMASASGGLETIMTAPQDMLDAIKMELVKELRAIILGVPQEIKNDGVDILEPRS